MKGNNFFDEKIVKKVKHYVYALFDPESDFPFYIGKGFGNRVFNHVSRKLKNSEELKYNKSLKLKKEN